MGLRSGETKREGLRDDGGLVTGDTAACGVGGQRSGSMAKYLLLWVALLKYQEVALLKLHRTRSSYCVWTGSGSSRRDGGRAE